MGLENPGNRGKVEPQRDRRFVLKGLGAVVGGVGVGAVGRILPADAQQAYEFFVSPEAKTLMREWDVRLDAAVISFPTLDGRRRIPLEPDPRGTVPMDVKVSTTALTRIQGGKFLQFFVFTPDRSEYDLLELTVLRGTRSLAFEVLYNQKARK